MLGVVNKLFVFKILLTTSSNVSPLHHKQIFPLIIWISLKVRVIGLIESRLPFKIFSNSSEGSCFSDRNSNRNSDWNSWLIPLASDFSPNHSRILNNISSADKQIKLDGHEIPIEKAAGCGYLMSKSSYVNFDKIWWS